MIRISHIDADDWHWVYIGQELIYEGHDNPFGPAFNAVMESIVGKWESQYAWAEDIPTNHEYMTEAASMNAPRLFDWVVKWGAGELEYFDWEWEND